MAIGIIIDVGGCCPPLDTERQDADADYFGNFRKFERNEDMAAEPTREQGNRKGDKE